MSTIVRWTPFAELDAMERRMRQMFEQVGLTPSVVPAADVYETTDEFVVELEAPGFEEKELGVEVSDHTLTVTGERKLTKEGEDKTFRRRERLEHTFVRRFELPVDADTEHVKASFTKGVLELHAPKVPTATPRKIEIAKS